MPETREDERELPEKRKVNGDLHKMMKKFRRKIEGLRESMAEMREDAEELAKYFEYSH